MKKVEHFGSLILMGQIHWCAVEKTGWKDTVFLYFTPSELPKRLFPPQWGRNKAIIIKLGVKVTKAMEELPRASAIHLAQKKGLEGRDREAFISQALCAIPFRLTGPAKDKSSMVCDKALRRRGNWNQQISERTIRHSKIETLVYCTLHYLNRKHATKFR